MRVNVTLYNAETMIEPCIDAVRKVYPDVFVHDFGSEDSGPDIVESMEVPLEKHGRLNGWDYVARKQLLSINSHKVFWVDADEVWPEESLVNVKEAIDANSLVVGFWRNLKVRQGHVYESDYIHRGAIAWDTTRYELHRTWPREKLRGKHEGVNRNIEEFTPNPKDIFCWHGVLLNVSSLPDKKNRWKKRAERDDQSANLEWTILEDLPFDYKDKRILEVPKFEWYK